MAIISAKNRRDERFFSFSANLLVKITEILREKAMKTLAKYGVKANKFCLRLIRQFI